jgi:serine/threonine-protein kinase
MPGFEKTEGTGDRVGGYRVVRRLATGGTSEVLLAKADGPLGFERSVVLKLLLSRYKHEDDFKKMFAREAEAYARLSHPSIVRLYDFLSSGDQLVMVLEYIDGPALSRLRGMLKAVGSALDDATAIFVSACIFDALAAAHGAVDDKGEAAPVIHRDVNPTNVLITWDAQVKLADFGIAKVTGASHQSSAGLIKGTYGYMAPEQVKGEDVTPRADVYAGALVLWEMLTKRRAFIRGALPEIEVLRELAEPRIVSIDVLRPDLDKSLRDALKRALEPRAEKRNVTAEEMVATLRALVRFDEGRDKLARALASVRHEPKVSRTSIPPAFGSSPSMVDEAETAKVLPARGMLPARPGPRQRPTPAPRPAVSVPRTTAPYGAPASPPASLGGPPKRTSSGKLTAAGPLPPATGPKRTASGMTPAALPAAPFSPMPMPPPLPLGARSASALDEVLRDIPSDVPPNVFPKTDPPGGVPSRAIGELPAAPLPMTAAGHAHQDSTLVMDAGPKTKAMPSSFPAMNRTLSMSERTDLRAEGGDGMPTGRLPPPLSLATTALMPPLPPPSLSPSTAKMRSFVVPPAALGSVAPPSNMESLEATPLGAPPAAGQPSQLGGGASAEPRAPFGSTPGYFGPSPPHAAQAQGAQAGRVDWVTGARASNSEPPRPEVASTPPNRPAPGSLSGSHAAAVPSEPPPVVRRGRPVLAVCLVLLVTTIAGVAAGADYMRWKKTRARIGTFPPAPALPSAGPPPSAGASMSAAPDSPPAAPASASPSASASAAASVLPPASAAASSSASESESVADLPPNSGRVRTAGAIPGRRIFVDERTVGQTPDSVVVKCGLHGIKLGSAGSTQSIEVPCGAEITVADH